MGNYAQFRNWHQWIGLILLLPLCVIAVTGFLWNHERRLGLTVVATDSGNPRDGQAALPVSTLTTGLSPLTAAPGTWQAHQAAIDAALTEAHRIWGKHAALERIELKNEAALGLVIKVRATDDASVRPYEITWSADLACVLEKKGDPASGTDWAKLIHDLHTGKFLSRSFGFLWSDLSALAIVLLGITGVVLYAIPVLKKRAKRVRSASQQRSASVRLATRPTLPQAGHVATRPIQESATEHV